MSTSNADESIDTGSLVQVVEDRALSAQQRIAALRSVMRLDPSAGKSILLRIAADESQGEELLRLAGSWLAELADAYVVSEFDVRELAAQAAEAFFADS